MQMITLLMEIISTCQELQVSYDWRATVLKLSPKMELILVRTFLWLLTQ